MTPRGVLGGEFPSQKGTSHTSPRSSCLNGCFFTRWVARETKGSSCARLSFWKSDPVPDYQLSAPGLLLHAQAAAAGRQRGRGCFKNRLPLSSLWQWSEPSSASQSKICNMPFFRWTLLLLAADGATGRCRVAATLRSRGTFRENAGARQCLSSLSLPVAREMVQDCWVWASPLLQPRLRLSVIHWRNRTWYKRH